MGNVDKQAISSLMTQYSLKAGLKKFGKKGEAAVEKELGQLHDFIVFIPINPANLDKDEKAMP